MAAEANIRLTLECVGLGGGSVALPPLKFTDTNTPDDSRRIDTVISTTENLLSLVVDIPSAEILGIGVEARDGNVYFNTISSNISTAGTFIPSGQGEFMSFAPGNSCVIAFKGDDADTAITAVIYSALTV